MNQLQSLREEFRNYLDTVRSETMSCENVLQKLQIYTADVYERIAEQLPAIMETIESNNDESRVLVSYFISGDSELNQDSVVSEELKDVQVKLGDAASSMRLMRTDDKELFQQIEEQVVQMSEIRDSISEIALISDDIELLSYNAGFVASRAGSSGAAFTYIAREIKKLSNRTTSLVERMRRNTEELVESYRQFNERIEKINTETDERLNNIEDHLGSIFNKYNTGLRNIAGLLMENLDSVNSIKQYVPKIMISLQDQDIIRQSLEQASSINLDMVQQLESNLRLYSNQRDDEVDTAMMEGTSALTILMSKLANELIGKITQNLDESLHKLSSDLSEFEQQLRDVEEDRKSLVDFFANAQDGLGNKSSIEMIFDESSEMITDLLQFIRNSIVQKREASKLGTLLIDNMEKTIRCFDEMHDIVKGFSLIKVASKMEIAREMELSRNITASSEMFEELTEKMETTIMQVRKQLHTADVSIRENLMTLSANLAQQQDDVATLTQNMEQSVSNLETMRENLNDAIRAVGANSTELFALIEDSLNGARTIKGLIGQAESISRQYSQIISQSEEFRVQGHQKGFTEFLSPVIPERFPGFMRMISKFTVYSDKEIASEIYDVDIEEGDAGGELTLF